MAYKYHSMLTDYLIVRWHVNEKIAPMFKPLLSFFLPPDAYSTTLMTVSQVEQLAGAVSPLLLKILHSAALNDSTTIGEAVSLVLAQGVLSVISFITLLLLTDLLIKFTGSVLHNLVDWGIFAPFNRLGGALFGILRGLLIVWIILAVIMPLQIPVAILGGETSLTQALENSQLAKMFWQVLTISDWSPAGNWLKPKDLEIYLKSI
ncbi:hypothetical protein JOC37_002224 [Desulfohalotomaculum tongense]|nr:hypothetical protein [Desulforadius tongensis]